MALTKYATTLHDMTLFSVDGHDIKAYFTDGTLEITAETIDFDFPGSEWKTREIGVKDWRVTCRKAIKTDAVEPIGLDPITGTDTVMVLVTAGSFSFSGTGTITECTIGLGNPWEESITIVQSGGNPEPIHEFA